MACVTTPSIILIGEYFDTRKALAHGLSVSLAGGVGAIFPPVLLYLFKHYGFTSTMMILAGIGLNCCVGGMLYRPFLDNFPPSVKRAVELKKSVNVQVTAERKSMNIQEMKKDPNADTKIHNDEDDNDDEKEIDESKSNIEDVEMMPLTGTKSDDQDKVAETVCNIMETKKDLEAAESKEYTEAVDAVENGATKAVKFNVDNDEESDEASPLKRERPRRESIFHEAKQKQKFLDCSLLKDCRFVSFAFVIFNNASTLGLTSAFIMVFAMEKGIPAYKATLLLTINSITGSVGTLIIGFLLDLPVIKRKRTFYYAACLFIVGLSTTINPVAINFLTFASISFARGAVAGSIMSQRATICVDILGRHRLRSSVGLILFATALGVLVGRTIGGK